MTNTMNAEGVYNLTCYDAEGNTKWEETAPNTVVFQGKNYMLDNTFAGSAYTANFCMSLITAGTATTASTYASPTVTEITSGIVNSNTRPAVSWTASSNGTKNAATTNFAITGGATITGNILVGGPAAISTVGNTAASGAILMSAATFATPKTVSSGDSISVTYSISV